MDETVFRKTLLQKKLMLPPLTAFTDYPFRQILSESNPPFITTEMVNAKAVIHKNKQTLKILEKVKGNHYSGVQLLGNDTDSMKKAAIILQNLGFDYIDVNMGCTVRKVACKGQGVSLMKNEDLACDIISNVSKSVDIPITVKLRTGFSKEIKNVLSLSKKLEDAGADAITVHGRSGEKKFGSEIDYDIIKQTSESVLIPVIANGGIFSGDDAKNVIGKTAASAVMPGRGIIGNPWLVSEILNCFSNKSFNSPNLIERKNICMKHIKYSCSFYGDRNGIIKMRKIIPRYFSLMKNLKFLKKDIQIVNFIEDIDVIFDRIVEIDDCIIYNFKG